MIRIVPSGENIFIYVTHFYTKLIGPLLFPELAKKVIGPYDYNSVARWTKEIDIFTKDVLMIPINIRNQHWSLFVVINPGKVISKVSDNEEMHAVVTPPFCLYMDSYAYQNNCHDKLIHYLNEEARNKGKFSSLEGKKPFDTESLPCFVPKGKY
jgi:Ulp1 family protease